MLLVFLMNVDSYKNVPSSDSLLIESRYFIPDAAANSNTDPRSGDATR